MLVSPLSCIRISAGRGIISHMIIEIDNHGKALIRAEGSDVKFVLQCDDGMAILTMAGSLVALWEENGRIVVRKFGESVGSPLAGEDKVQVIS